MRQDWNQGGRRMKPKLETALMILSFMLILVGVAFMFYGNSLDCCPDWGCAESGGDGDCYAEKYSLCTLGAFMVFASLMVISSVYFSNYHKKEHEKQR